MPVQRRIWLLPAALNGAVVVLHLAIILGGAAWYRFFGLADELVLWLEQGSWLPHFLLLGLASTFAVWMCFALSAAGIMRRFWMLRPVLTMVTLLYLVRGLAGLAAPLFYLHPAMAVEGISYWIWSSLVCVAAGLVHLNALVDTWGALAAPEKR
ncbi:hypothetical protein WKI13_01220 [Teredinibacter turnerae]|uniref:hypothetical protein n=1 Tax=Teredinibacter turnerae TaxID=2426 RepID=UPI00035D6E2B|nr:hypothetical protein [Teredinibacter turnerae]